MSEDTATDQADASGEERIPVLIVPLAAAQRIRDGDAPRGDLRVTHDPVEDTFVVTHLRVGDSSALLPVPMDKHTYLGRAREVSHAPKWARGDIALHFLHTELRRRPGHATTYSSVREQWPSLPRPGSGPGMLLLTHAADVPDDLRQFGVPEFAAWYFSDDEVSPWPVLIEPRSHGVDQLLRYWPVEYLAERRVLVVGTGSIGGRSAQALAAYGIGHLDLLDPDRLLWHNTVRHVLNDTDVGRHKVTALRQRLIEHWPSLKVTDHRLDVVEHADQVRALLDNTDLVLCAADGVAPRRVVSHLARRAGIPAVLACVLEDGAVGEVLRLRPGPTQGCLLCHRALLASSGGIDPEAAQELGYSTGAVHRPMTAVGADLHLVADLAAKTAVATLLEAHGEFSQHLPGDHAVLALRPRPGTAPPYDASPAGTITWHRLPAPRPACPTCSPA